MSFCWLSGAGASIASGDAERTYMGTQSEVQPHYPWLPEGLGLGHG